MSWRDSNEADSELLGQGSGRTEELVEHEDATHEVMKIVLGGEADAGQHLLAVSSGGMGAPSGQCLGHGRRVGRLIAPGGLQHGLCRLDGHQGLGQPMAHRLKVADGPVELDASQGVRTGQVEHPAGRSHQFMGQRHLSQGHGARPGARLEWRPCTDVQAPSFDSDQAEARVEAFGMPHGEIGGGDADDAKEWSRPSARATTTIVGRPIKEPGLNPPTVNVPSVRRPGGTDCPKAGQTTAASLAPSHPSAHATTSLRADEVVLPYPCNANSADTAASASVVSASRHPRSSRAWSRAVPD